MKVVVGIPILALLLLSLTAAILVLNFSYHLFQFALFNVVILAIIASYRPPANEVDGGWQGLQSSYEAERDAGYDSASEEEDDDDDDYSSDEDGDEYNGSDGYDEDDDETGSDGEIGWEEDDELPVPDEELDRRFEDFIAKVVKGWREEWLIDRFQVQGI